MNYRDAIGYIDSLSSRGWVFGLRGIKGILDRIGNPERSLRCIHIAGTNGKGSVATMIHDVLSAHGLKVGLYTSPHILSFRERIVVSGRKITRDEVVYYVESMKRKMGGYDSFTYFDFTTALAFSYFRDVGVDIAVIEVGLGGRLDSTNVVIPEVSVITRISYDHTDVLGSTLREIAREKAGIVKDGVPVVLLKQDEEVESVVLDVARSRNSRLYTAGFFKGDLSTYGDRTSLSYRGVGFSISGMDISHLPPFQAENVALSLGALDISGFDPDPSKVGDALRSVRVPGRFEVFIEGSHKVVFDVGHNPSCMETLRRSVEETFRDERFLVVMGVLKDKDAKGMFRAISPVSEGFFFIPLPTERAEDPLRLMEECRSLGFPAEGFSDPKEAVEEALSASSRVLFTGSFYTVMVAKGVLIEICGELSS